MKFSLRDVLHVLVFGVIAYFFIFGCMRFYEERLVCDFVVRDYYGSLSVPLFNGSLSVSQVKFFVGSYGLFENGLDVYPFMSLSNCSFRWKRFVNVDYSVYSYTRKLHRYYNIYE